MSEIHALKEITLDAARYRWLREQVMVIEFHVDNDISEVWECVGDDQIDNAIDKRLALDN